MSNRSSINERVVWAAESALDHHHYVSPVDILMGIGFLQPVHFQDWKKGKIPYLEPVIQGSLDKISLALQCFRTWAHQKGLNPIQIAYPAGRGDKRKELQFSKSGDPETEEFWRTHYVSPLLGDKKQEKLKEKLEKPPEPVVFMIINATQCSQCNTDLGRGNLLSMESGQPLCLGCAGLDDLVFLTSGDAKLTRAAKKYSAACIIVVRFSRARKRYERQGILVEEDALHKAKTEVKCISIKA